MEQFAFLHRPQLEAVIDNLAGDGPA